MTLKLFRLFSLSSLFFLISCNVDEKMHFKLFVDRIMQDTLIESINSFICAPDSTTYIANIDIIFYSEDALKLFNLDRNVSSYDKIKELNEFEIIRDSTFTSIKTGLKAEIENCKYYLELDKFNDSIYLSRIVLDDFQELHFSAKFRNDSIIYYEGSNLSISYYQKR